MSNDLIFNIIGNNEYSKSITDLQVKLPSIQKVLAATAGAVAAVSGTLFAMAKTTATTQDAIGKFSDRIGISTEALSRYHAVAEFSGISTTTLETSFQRMTRRVAEAAEGTGVATKALEDLGIPIEDIQGLAPDIQFEKIAAALDGVEDQGKKASIAMQIFDTEGVALLQTITNGTEGLEAMKDEADRFGLVVSGNAAKNAAEFNDSIQRSTMAFTGLKNAIGEEVIPVFTELFNMLADFLADNREDIISFGTRALEIFASIAEKGIWAVGLLVDGWKGLQMIWLALEIGLNELVVHYVSGVGDLVNTIITGLEKVNIKGVFDEIIEGGRGFEAEMASIAEVAQAESAKAQEALLEMATEPFGQGIEKAKEFTDSIRTAIEEISAAQLEAAEENPETGLSPFSQENLELTIENIEATKEIMDEANSEIYDRTASHYDNMEGLQVANFTSLAKTLDNAMLTNTQKHMAWYNTQKLALAGQHGELQLLEMVHSQKMEQIEFNKQQAIMNTTSGFFGAMASLTSAFGAKNTAIFKALAITQTVISTYAAITKTLAEPALPYPANIIQATAIGIQGFANVANIASAHGGLSYVPQEQTYLLDRGERVLSPNQNSDLTSALQGGQIGGGSVGEMNVSIHVLENATSPDALLSMDKFTWEKIISEKMIPVFKNLSTAGVTI